MICLAAFVSSCCTPCTRSAPQIGDLEQASWTLIEQNNTPIENSGVGLTFDPGSKTFAGTAPCNKFFGSYHLYTPKKGERKNINFAEIGGTMRLCPDAQVEEDFTRMLPTITRVKIEGDHLLMFNPGDSLMAVLVRQTK